MVHLGQAVAMIISPSLAGVLVTAIGLQGVILIDVITFVLAVGTLLFVRIPSQKPAQASVASKGSLLEEVAYGWRYIASRPGLLGLLILFAVSNYSTSIVQGLFAPMILSFSTPTVLGTLLSAAGLGMLSGSLVMSVWGGPKRRIYGVLGAVGTTGLCILCAGIRPWIPLIAVAAFGGCLGSPVINASSQAIWQVKTPPDVQGRVFAIRHVIAWSSIPLAYLTAGPLADQVFEPLLAVGGPLADTVGRVTGVGPGRGIGLLFVIMGTLNVLAAAGGTLYPRLRLVEDELPDATEEVAGSATSG